jgi:5'-nucleotidase
VKRYLFVLLLAACAGTRDPAPEAGRLSVKVIAFNDFHGNLHSPGAFAPLLTAPAADRVPVGGAEYLAAHVARLKSANPLNVVVAAGDLVGATPLVSALFHDEPTVEVLNRIGLEFSAVGNHEFDRGAAHLLRLQRGARFQWLAANVVEKASGRTLLPAYAIKRFGDVEVGFIGMTLRATPTIVSPQGVAGLEFRDEADTVNSLLPALRARGIEAIVVLVHEGGVQSGPRQPIDGCEGGLAGSAIARLVSRLDDAVDLAVAGHSHAAFVCRLPNAAGRRIPVTSASAFGRMLTDIDLTLDNSTRDVVAVAAANRLVARDDPAVVPDAAVAAIVDRYAALIAPTAGRVVGSVARELPNARVDRACNMPAGELVADAMLEATRGADAGGAVIAFMNGGGVRSPGFRAGDVTYGEAFTVQPFGNSLVTLTLTAAQLKDALEEQFAGCRGQSVTTTRVMLPSAGFKYTWDGARSCDSRIRSATLTTADGTEAIVVDGALAKPSKTYRIAVNSYMAAGGDGYSTLPSGGNPQGGPQDIDALVSYLSGFKAPNAPYKPGTRPEDRGTARIHRIGGTSCPGGANTNP